MVVLRRGPPGLARGRTGVRGACPPWLAPSAGWWCGCGEDDPVDDVFEVGPGRGGAVEQRVLQDQRWAGSGQHGDGGFGADLAPYGRFEQDVEDELQAWFDHLVADEGGQGVAGGAGGIVGHRLQVTDVAVVGAG